MLERDPMRAFPGRRHLIVLPVVALLAVAPLMVHGCSCGHDFDFHLLSWFEAASQIAHGNLHPHWAFTPAWNAGEPRFVFYPPLSWYLGAVLGLVMPWTWTPVVYTWMALSAAGLACHRLLQAFVPPPVALLVSALYMVNPYLLFTAYERTAYAELLCAAWLPLLLLGILRERPAIEGIAGPVALLWLTNAPAAVLGTYSLALLALVRVLQRGPGWPRLAGTTVAGTGLGLGLGAFYIFPAAVERKYVEIALVKAQSLLITDNFLFAHTGDADHDAVLRTASMIAAGLLAAMAVALVAAFRGERARRTDARHRVLLPMAVLAGGIGFLLTPLSAWIWLHTPQLAFLQFPWRFVAMLTPALALVLALALTDWKDESMRVRNAPGLLLMGVFLGAGVHVFFQRCDAEDTPAARLALFHSAAGSEPTDEYTPDTADEDALAHTNPPFWLADRATAAAPANAAAGPLRWPLELTIRTPEVLILNLRDYPAWRVSLNRHVVRERLERADGLIALPVPAGAATLTLAYARTPDQRTGEIVSIISLAALLYLLYRRRR